MLLLRHARFWAFRFSSWRKPGCSLNTYARTETCTHAHTYIHTLSYAPASPSLISLVVCVDVKHHVCLLTSSTGRLELFQPGLRNIKLRTGGKTQYTSQVTLFIAFRFFHWLVPHSLEVTWTEKCQCAWNRRCSKSRKENSTCPEWLGESDTVAVH